MPWHRIGTATAWLTSWLSRDKFVSRTRAMIPPVARPVSPPTLPPGTQVAGYVIEERIGTPGGFIRMNPRVDDLPDALSAKLDSIKLMRLGGVKKGGSGCICPESALLRALVMHIVLRRDEVVVMDMEAGIEHLGRATAKAVDKLIVVVEPGRRSIDTAEHIRRLAAEIALQRIVVVGNKIRSSADEEFLKSHLPDFEFLGFLPQDDRLIEAIARIEAVEGFLRQGARQAAPYEETVERLLALFR